MLLWRIKIQPRGCLKRGVDLMKIKLIAGATVLSLAGVVGLMLNDISRMSPETLILCVLNEGGILIPSGLCEYYMYNRRDVDSDIEVLSSGPGLSFILEGKDIKKRYEIADYFILNGLDVNGVNHSGGYNITPLHGAVLDNDLDMARFLLEHGASKNIKAPTINMDPLELVQSLQQKEPTIDRKKMIEILMN